MDTVLLIVKTKEEALACVDALTTHIKSLPDEHQHKLFFRRILMGAYTIFPVIEDKPDDRELIIFPASRQNDLDRLKGNKNLLYLNNAMCVVGDGEKTTKRRTNLIEWLLRISELDNS